MSRERLILMLESGASSVIAVLIGVLASTILMVIWGYDPIKAYRVMLFGDPETGVQGAFGGAFAIRLLVREFALLTMTGLATAISFAAAMFNIGVEGSMYIGAIVAFAVAYNFSTGIVGLDPLIAIVAGVAAAAAWSAIPAILKVKFGAHEVVTTIMMNYIAKLITELIVITWFLAYTGIGGGGLVTPRIPESARIPYLHFGTVSIDASILFAIFSIVFAVLVMKVLVIGYEVYITGMNPYAAEYGGIDPKKTMVLAMVMSGVIAGLAGCSYVLGIEYRFSQTMSPPGYEYGFAGIPIALIGRLDPIGVVLAAFLLAVLRVGAQSLEPALGMPKELSMAIQGVIVVSAAIPSIVALVIRWIRVRRIIKEVTK